MAIVVILDQQGSRTEPDLVGEWTARLNDGFGSGLALPFTRTAGDEMQAVIGRPEALGEIVRQVLASESWWLGIGLGEVERPLPEDTREGRGPAFWSAREAVAKAKSQRASRPIAVRGADGATDTAAWLDECLGALAFIISRRTEAQRRVAGAWQKAGSVQAVADELGISVQGSRQRILAAGCEEEDDLVRLAARIAAGELGS